MALRHAARSRTATCTARFAGRNCRSGLVCISPDRALTPAGEGRRTSMYPTRIRTAIATVIAVVVSTGMASAADAPGAALSAPGSGVLAVDPPIVPADAQTKWRWIGVAAPPPFPAPCTFAPAFCPTSPTVVPTWTTTDLFDAPLPPGLQGFCAYETAVAGPPAVLNDLLVNGCLTQLSPDVMAVVPFADPQEFEKLVWQPLHDNFMRQG